MLALTNHQIYGDFQFFSLIYGRFASWRMTDCAEFGGAKPCLPAGRRSHNMHRNKILRFAESLLVLPILTLNIGFSGAGMAGQPLFNRLALLGGAEGMQGAVLSNQEQTDAMKIALERGKLIDNYFSKRDMPLEGFGTKMAIEADKNGIDWRLIPAIAIRESSGGKNACDNNPFGWDSCKTNFKSTDEAIEIVAWNLGGNNPKTKKYYEIDDTRHKLHHYNGTVVRRYEDQVLNIMDQIDGTD